MSLISESYHNEKLKKHNINIKTKYIVGNKILEKNTDGSNNDDISNGIRCQKDYYINNRCVHTEKLFDSRIEYTFISKSEENEEYTCKNCGMNSKLKDFLDGCPYCGTYYNIDYTDKDLGGKYHYDRVLRKKTYRIITAIIDLVISLSLTYVYIKNTSRTFNNYDISKIFIYGTILYLILYYLFYIMDAYVILGPIKRYKDKQNRKQMKFWDRTKIDKKTFFNNLNYEVGKKYYLKDDIIDYDILDYLDFKEYRKNDKLYVKVKVDVRIVYLKNNKIKSKFIQDTYVLLKHNNKTIELKDGANMIKCPNCGASVDAKKGYCEYCNSKVGYLQEWIMEE